METTRITPDHWFTTIAIPKGDRLRVEPVGKRLVRTQVIAPDGSARYTEWRKARAWYDGPRWVTATIAEVA